MDRGRIPHDAFVGFDEDTNDEPPFFPDDFDGHFEHDMEHFEEPPEFSTNASVQENYDEYESVNAPVQENYDEYESVSPFKRPPPLAANRNDTRKTKRTDGHRGGRDTTRTEMSYDTNPRQARGFQPEKDTVPYKHVETSKRARNRSPCDSFMESRPTKMPSLLAGTRENPREKDKYLSTARTGQPQYGARSTANPNKQSTKEDQNLTSKFEHPEKGILTSDEVIILREALEKSKAVSKRLENEAAKNERRLAQINQENENLQKQIIELDKEKNACITEAHKKYCTARDVLKMQNQFQKNVEQLAVYLNNKDKIKETVASACSTSSLTKFEETLNFWRTSSDEIKTTKKSCREFLERLNKSVEETSIDNEMESNLKRLSLDVNKNLVLCREKRIQYEMIVEKTREDIMSMDAETNRLKAITNAHRDHKKTKLINFLKLAKSQIEFARKQKDSLKDQVVKQIAQQKEVIDSLSNDFRDVVAKLELSRAKNRDLERDVNAAKSKLEKVKEEYRLLNLEFDKMEKLGTSRGQTNLKTPPIVSQIKMKFKKLRELEAEKRQYEEKKLLLVEKLKRAHDISETKREEADLQDRLMKITQLKKTTMEMVSVMKKTQQKKELGIRVAKEKSEALIERRRKLLEQLNAPNNLMMQERKAQVSMLCTLSRIKGEENLGRDMKQQEVSSKENEILEKMFKIADLELETERINKENQYLDDMCRTQKEKLVKVKCEKERAESKIRMLKKFVRDRLYTTVQEINKATKDLVKKIESVELEVKVLEENVTGQKRKLKELRKSKNLSLK